VFPNEEPPPAGDGEGGIVRAMGLDGFANPRLLWQSRYPTARGELRKPATIVPVAANVRKTGAPIPEAKQRKAAGPNPISYGSGSAKRWYKRPTLRIQGEKVPDRGEPVRQLRTGAVWWQSKRARKDGSLPEPRLLEPLTSEQVRAIEFQHWLEKHYPDPVKRFLYLVREWDALVIVNHSGGKDSQAMYLHLTRDLGVPHGQIRVVHADLPGADWPGTLEHVQGSVDHDVKVVRAKFSSGAIKELYDYVLRRGKFPSAQQRYCTSDLKTTPINAWIKQALCELNGLKKPCDIPPGAHRVVISAMGMRAQESDNRAGLSPWELNVGQSIAGRVWLEYLPIHRWKTAQVFRQIKRFGQEPFWIYGRTPAHRRRLLEAGSVDERGNAVPMQRMSCVFCIMGSLRDLGVASKIGPPEIARRICKTEIETGHTFRHGVEFPELIRRGEAAVTAGRKGLERKAGRTRVRLDVLTQARAREGPCP
jgi:3'-phosphoadenosine 5'-phosphosulfate sulfotransferase (PAPS reductase)/FAD synthetase